MEPEAASPQTSVVPEGKGNVIIHMDPRPMSDDPLERLSWSVDSAGREALTMPDVRQQLELLMTWPGRVSGWRRASHVWVCDVRWGETYILGVENSRTWPRPGVATLNPASVVGTASLGCPPALRTVRLSDRADHVVVAAICLPTGTASLVEMTGANSLPGTGMLSEGFAPGRGDAAGFRVGNEQFDSVRPLGVVVVNAGLSMETGVLLGDSTGAARAWMHADHTGDVRAGLGISQDNRQLADQEHRRIELIQPTHHLGEMRRAVVSILGATSR